MHLRICGSPQDIFWSANRKSANCHICGGKFVGLRFAELICEPPPFDL